MGMFSELAAAGEAAALEKAILEAKNKYDNEFVRLYIKRVIYPLYQDAISETFGYAKESPEVLAFIASIKNA
jgi:hypothetical protein